MESGQVPSSVSPSPPTPDPPRGLPPAPLLAGIAVLIAVLVGAVWVLPSLTRISTSPDRVPASAAAVVPSGLATPAPSLSSSPRAAVSPASTTLPGGPFGAAGSIAVLGNDGSLSLVDASSGRSTGLSPASEAVVAFPGWSPDGSRIAAIRATPAGPAILVYDARRAAAGQPVEPVVIFRSSTIGPFYLSWTPDGQAVSFLGQDAEELTLRIAPADGSAALDGSDPRTKIRAGNPLYFDWIDRDRLLAHVGTGPFAFLGEIALDGTPQFADLQSPGDFRSIVVSRGGTFVGYVRSTAAGSGEVVVAARDGSRARTMPVFGTAAVAFDPTSDTIASIGPARMPLAPYAIPLGPLRLMDAASGKHRTLLDGIVVSFWWSPDGKTIAALRVQPIEGAAASAGPRASQPPNGSPTAEPTEVRLLFVDVASGDIRSQSVVEVGQLFIDQLLTYFDQYALSHRIWAPDSSSLLLPVREPSGGTRLAIMDPDGDAPRSIDGAIGFWSP